MEVVMDRRTRFFLALIVICAVSLAGCASKTPVEHVAASRAAYKATLNSFFVKETPIVDETVDLVGEVESEAVTESGAEPEAGDAGSMPAPEVRQDAVLDVIVQHDTREQLAGLTLDVSMVDAEENEIRHWLHWIDTTGLLKANQRPYSIVFEDVDYQEGYGFHVEVRHPLADSELGQYREFDGL
jgi:hypothetical protein